MLPRCITQDCTNIPDVMEENSKTDLVKNPYICEDCFMSYQGYGALRDPEQKFVLIIPTLPGKTESEAIEFWYRKNGLEEP
jgi:hypothetical protein